MSRQLTVTINLGNAAMCMPEDAVMALRQAADWVRDAAPSDPEAKCAPPLPPPLPRVCGNLIVDRYYFLPLICFILALLLHPKVNP